MSDCRCSGTPSQNDTWDYHSDYCPVFMQGQINALEQERDALLARVGELEPAARDFMQLADNQALALAVSLTEYERYVNKQKAHVLAVLLPTPTEQEMKSERQPPHG